MKKLLLALLLISSSHFVTAQESTTSDDKPQRKNDIVADPILLIAAPMINVSYERLIDDNQGIGVNAMILMGDNENFSQYSAYYRMYFGKKYGAGFFLEGFVPVTNEDVTFYQYTYNPVIGGYNEWRQEESFTTVGVGFGVGGKWVVRKNIVFEISGGLARRFGEDADYYLNEVTGKFMAGVGYRF